MFGDFFAPPLVIEFRDAGQTGGPALATAELPRGGALRRTKISDNGATLPTDRVYFLYNHFANALDQLTLDPTGQFRGPNSRESVDRYTAGFEKTFFYGGGSIELRVPFSSPNDLDLQPQFDTAIIAPGQEFGNMNVAFKALVTEYADFASAIGLAVDVPTGEDVDATFDSFPPGSQFPGDLVTFHIENETVYLQPFIAALMTPTERTFVQGFILVDIPVGGDWITVTDPVAGTMDVGRLEDATLLHVDVAVGRWLFQGSPGLVRGLAGVVEFHYSPMVSDPGVVNASRGGFPVSFGSAERLEYADLTVGLHAQLGNDTTLRVGGAFPLRDRPDRTFDAELLVQVNRFLR